MTISLSRYVSITSGVGAGAGVSTRDLNARFFTENVLVPTASVVTFSSAADVGTYFGSSSDEYKRAVFYFGWTSKNNTSPSQIGFARWANVAVASTIFGDVATYALGSFTSVTTGDFTLTLGGATHHLTSINLTGAGNLAAVAALIEDAIQGYTAGGAPWTGATVTYNSTRKSFDMVSGATGADTIAITAGATTDVASLLGWLTGAILSNGSAAQSITAVLTQSADASNDFGSFAFVPVLTLDQVTEAAEWNDALGATFMYSVPVTVANASAWSAALINIGGVTLTLAPLSAEYPEQAPMMLLGATDYSRRNSVQNYMFQQFNLTPSVTSNAGANTYDGLRINYYGQTQTAGQLLSFYQRGLMFGIPTDPVDQNVYANEIWLKDASSAAIMGLLLALAQIPANAQGRSQIISVIQGIINQGVINGAISVGKPLTDTQKSYITNITGDNLAWQQVSNIGYWLDVDIVSYVESTVTKYKAVYTLIYSKDDVIRKVEGSDILI